MEIDRATLATRPLRPGGFTSVETFGATALPHPLADVSANAAGMLRLAHPAVRCENTAYGCFGDRAPIVTPAKVFAEERSAAGACVSFAAKLEAGWIVGLERADTTELRAFAQDDGSGAVDRPDLARSFSGAPTLVPVSSAHDEALLAAPATGDLFRIRWRRGGALQVARAPQRLPEGPSSILRDGDRLLAVSPNHLVALDQRTLRERWRLAGRFIAFVGWHGGPRLFVLERTAGGLAVDDIDAASGAVLRSARVYAHDSAYASLDLADASTLLLTIPDD